MENVVHFVWGIPLLVLIVGTGVFLMIRLKFLPIRKIGYGLRMAFSRQPQGGKAPGDISPFGALMTSLASTIGTANIAGVATAIAIGGPGAVFWMWVSALAGLATKYAEAVLAVKFREKASDGRWRGGPMYVLRNGLEHKRLGKFAATLFAMFTVIASFGIGNMAQANSAADAASTAFGIHPIISGVVMAALCGAVIVGGVRSVAGAASRIVPVMGVLYIAGGLIVIAMNVEHLGEGLANIVTSAFTGQAAVGAFAGSSAIAAMRIGVARSVFSNEAGLGSAPIAAAAAKTDNPARQGFVSMTGTFLDTLVVCSITALVIACTGTWQQANAIGEPLTGAAMTVAAFGSSLATVGEYIVSVGLALFAFSSILGWSVYGEAALYFLVPSKRAKTVYRTLFCMAVLLGAVFPFEMVWGFSDVANALMALPNLLCLLLLSGLVARETRGFMTTRYRKENH